MKITTRALLMATAITCFGFGLVPDANARIYVKEFQPSPTQHDDIGTPFDEGTRGGDDNVVVPEPGTLALLGIGLASMAAARRKRKAANE